MSHAGSCRVALGKRSYGMRTLWSLVGLVMLRLFPGTPSSENPDGSSTDSALHIDPLG